MKKISYFIFILISLFLASNFASALTTINIYLDESGNSLFLGKSDAKTLDLPEGINLTNGKIIGNINYLTQKIDDTWYFSFNLNNSEFEIEMPKETVIKNISSGEIYIRNNIIYVYAHDNISLAYTLTNKDSSNFNYNYLLIPVLILLILYLYYKVFKKKEKIKIVKRNNLNVIKKVLNEREKIIIANLEKSGKIKMSYLRKISDIPKASFSRHINELEKKSLIKKSGSGKNKFVELKK